jgi:acyl-coenzyme A synthetase/AMP-(fatty) acid ligase
VTEDELVKLSSQLGETKTITGGIKFLDELPHTGSGKVDRRKLKEMAQAYTI